MEGTIIKPLTLSGEKDWLLIKLDKSINYNFSQFEYVVIKPKSGSILSIKTELVIIYFGLVSDLQDTLKVNAEKSMFTFVDWVKCRLSKK